VEDIATKEIIEKLLERRHQIILTKGGVWYGKGELFPIMEKFVLTIRSNIEYNVIKHSPQDCFSLSSLTTCSNT